MGVVKIVITAIAAVSLLTFAGITSAFGYMYHVTHGFSANADWKKVSGTFEVPLPSMPSGNHKDYLVYITHPFYGVGLGSGLYYQNTGSGVISCYLKLFADDTPDTNYHLVTCNPAPSTSISASISQNVNDGKTWTGTSGPYSASWTLSSDGAKNPRYFGATSGSTTDNLNLYMGYSNLKVFTWGGAEYTFTNAPATYKCWVESGYKYDLTTNGNYNAFRTGPPAITQQECSIQQDSYRLNGLEWNGT